MGNEVLAASSGKTKTKCQRIRRQAHFLGGDSCQGPQGEWRPGPGGWLPGVRARLGRPTEQYLLLSQGLSSGRPHSLCRRAGAALSSVTKDASAQPTRERPQEKVPWGGLPLLRRQAAHRSSLGPPGVRGTKRQISVSSLLEIPCKTPYPSLTSMRTARTARPSDLLLAVLMSGYESEL